MSEFGVESEPQWIAHNRVGFAINSRSPLSPGHALVIPKQHVTSWWDAGDDEQRELLQLVRVVRDMLVKELAPGGVSISIDEALLTGSATERFCIHIVPNYETVGPDSSRGDSERNLLGGQRLGLLMASEASAPRLSTPYSDDFRVQLLECLRDPKFDRIDLLVSFVMMSGLELIKDRLDEALRRGARVRVLTTDYMLVTDASALGHLLDRLAPEEDNGSLQVRVFSNPARSFHAKAYLFSTASSRSGVAFVGSSNLSRSALTSGVEWNVRYHRVGELLEEFESLWTNEHSTPLSSDFVGDYRARKEALGERRIEPAGEPVHVEDVERAPTPWGLQLEALHALEATRIAGFRRGLVVMATGLGKTWLAAFDSVRPMFRRVLFVAHREEILDQARDTYRRIKPDGTFSMFAGGSHDVSGDVVFASVQALHGNLAEIGREHFDYIVVDEFHHASAPTYRRVIEHFHPSFLLGLTATPDRSDAADLLALCDDNLVYRCDLLDGIRCNLLSPFRYRAIRDVADYQHLPWRNGRFSASELAERLETQQRCEQVFDEWVAVGGRTKRALGFCCSISHADHLADFFLHRGVRAVAVHSGPTSAPRSKSLDDLAAKVIDVIFTVDLFNEGIDVPTIDLVMMLRPTESGIVFLQQLGRGLRAAEGKTHLDVIDFVGNHRSFLLKARLIALLAGLGKVADQTAVQFLKTSSADLPAGCSIVADIEAVDLLEQLAKAPEKLSLYAAAVDAWMTGHAGERPTALEFSVDIGRAIELKKFGGWFGFLDSNGWLDDAERSVLSLAGPFLLEVETDANAKCFRLLTLQAMQAQGSVSSPARLSEIAMSCRWRVFSDPRLMSDLADASTAFMDKWKPTVAEWAEFWSAGPINELVGDSTEDAGSHFVLESGSIRCTVSVPPGLVSTFDAMLAEILEYRLHRYVVGRRMSSESFKRRPVTDDGRELHATFHLETVGGNPVAVVIDSSGGAKSSPAAVNVDYVEGFDVVLSRLKALSAVVVDAYVHSTVTQRLPIADRRLSAGVSTYPVELGAVEDVTVVRKAFQNSMRKVGQRPGVKGGNSNKTVRLVLSGLPSLAAEMLADSIAGLQSFGAGDGVRSG